MITPLLTASRNDTSYEVYACYLFRRVSCGNQRGYSKMHSLGVKCLCPFVCKCSWKTFAFRQELSELWLCSPFLVPNSFSLQIPTVYILIRIVGNIVPATISTLVRFYYSLLPLHASVSIWPSSGEVTNVGFLKNLTETCNGSKE
jgi:hypothetical protein